MAIVVFLVVWWLVAPGGPLHGRVLPATAASSR
jgi:hypothetical protein